MNRSSFSFPLSSKFLIALGLVAILPFAAFVLLLANTLTALTFNNVSAYLIESTARRQQNIERNFYEALQLFDNFVGNYTNIVAINRVLEVFNRPDSTPERQNQVVRAFVARAQLDMLNNERQFFNSLWLLSPRGELLASQSVSGFDLPFNRSVTDQRQSEIYTTLNRLALRALPDANLRRAAVATQRDDGPSIEIGYVIANERSVLGYIVADININNAILAFLRPQDNLLEAYSFAVLDGNTALSLPSVSRLVSLDSNLVRQAVSSPQQSGVAIYTTNTSPPRRVVGYAARAQLTPDLDILLVTEVSDQLISRQVTNFLGNIAFPFLLGLFVLLGLASGLLSQIIVPPLNQLREAIRAMNSGRYDAPIPSTQRPDEIGGLANSFADMRAQVSQLIDTMTNQLDERQRDLRVTQDISRITTEQRNLQNLLNNVVDLIVQNFPSIYHAQIFLLDAEGEYAVLRASTGEAGQNLLARGHKLAVGGVSVIGQVTEQGQIVIARDTAASNVHRQNEFLPQTRAELAIPLRLGSKIIGALDVQSTQRDSFPPDQVTALQTLADQVTIAIENARLYEASQRLLADIEAEKRARTGRAWREYLRTQRESVASVGNPTETDFSELRRAAVSSGQPVVGEATPRRTIPFVVPIRLRGQTLGVVEYELSERDFNYNKVLLAEELVNRLSISLDNARLFQDSQRAAERERLVNDISAKLTGQTDIEEILEIAVREVSLALRTPQVALQLHTANGASHHVPQSDEG
ncbi:MAG: GAF domain-containing protein [Anaerolineae bacterium]|nr:GAF domain-containing protein [Anaerolineae bacterium]MDW8173675.1 GAF domain-containing protein [Anaerolineae bacterium]